MKRTKLLTALLLFSTALSCLSEQVDVAAYLLSLKNKTDQSEAHVLNSDIHVTPQDRLDWDTAFGWGDHAGLYREIGWVPSWGDLTDIPQDFPPSAHEHDYTAVTNPPWLTEYTETDEIALSRVTVLEGKTNNWNTAYGWGDHALAGYLTNETNSIALAIMATNRTTVVFNPTNSNEFTDGAMRVWRISTVTNTFIGWSVAIETPISICGEIIQPSTNQWPGIPYPLWTDSALSFTQFITNYPAGSTQPMVVWYYYRTGSASPHEVHFSSPAEESSANWSSNYQSASATNSVRVLLGRDDLSPTWSDPVYMVYGTNTTVSVVTSQVATVAWQSDLTPYATTAALAVHTNRTDNPHNVTAPQIGALTEEADPVAGPRLDRIEAGTNAWQTAYGWGDHAGLYRDIGWVPSWTEVIGKPDLFDWNYDSLTNKPATFPPSAHTHPYTDITDPPWLASLTEQDEIALQAVFAHTNNEAIHLSTEQVDKIANVRDLAYQLSNDVSIVTGKVERLFLEMGEVEYLPSIPSTITSNLTVTGQINFGDDISMSFGRLNGTNGIYWTVTETNYWMLLQ